MEEEQEKKEEEKPSPKTEAGKMLCSGDPGRLTSQNFPGASGQDIARGGKDLALLGVCILTGGEERERPELSEVGSQSKAVEGHGQSA